MKVKLTFTIYCMICFCGCFHNPPERNKMVFTNSYKDVQDSLSEMIKLLPKLSKRADSLNTNYNIENGKLFINDTLQKDNLVNAKMSSFTNGEKMRFIKLSFYLNKNFMSCAYSGYSENSWYFEYRNDRNEDFNDSRNITLLDNENLVSSLDSVIDRKDKLFLVVGKGAILR